MVEFKTFGNAKPRNGLYTYVTGFFDADDAFTNAFFRAMQFETGGYFNPNDQDCVDGTNRRKCGESGGKHDRGGNTKFGVAQNAHPGLDVDSLTMEQAKDIYRKGYWDSVRADELDPVVGYIMFNIACGSGPTVAIKILQRALGVRDTGRFDDQTMAAVSRHQGDIPSALISGQKDFYAGIVRRRPSQSIFLKGWNLRADWFCRKEITDDIADDAARIDPEDMVVAGMCMVDDDWGVA